MSDLANWQVKYWLDHLDGQVEVNSKVIHSQLPFQNFVEKIWVSTNE